MRVIEGEQIKTGLDMTKTFDVVENQKTYSKGKQTLLRFRSQKDCYPFSAVLCVQWPSVHTFFIGQQLLRS